MRLLAPVLLLLTALSIGHGAAAAPCRAAVNASEIVVDPDALQAAPGRTTLRERGLRWPSRAFDWARGTPPACDSATLITYLAGAIPPDQIDGYCLVEDAVSQGFMLVPGARNFRGRCATTTCEKVNAAKEDVAAATSAIAAAAGSTSAAAGKASAVMHGSGAAILTGGAQSLAGALGSVGTAIGSVLTAPVALAAGAVSVIAVGGALYVCSG